MSAHRPPEIAPWLDWHPADWPAPAGVHAGVTGRRGGTSTGPYATWNLADHCGDDPGAVAANRQRLRDGLGLPSEPHWLRQVHGNRVVALPGPDPRAPEADGAYTRESGLVCAVLTADCLPVLITARDGSVIAAAHAGWRGLAAGIVEATVDALGHAPDQLQAWLGPAIGPTAYTVGETVRDAFRAQDPESAAAFRRDPAGGWFADLDALARQRLVHRGVEAIYGGRHCTWSEPATFFSHRRDGTTGRMASLIWRDPST